LSDRITRLNLYAHVCADVCYTITIEALVVTLVHYLSGNIELSVILCLPSGNDNHLEGLSDDLLQLINVYQLKPFKAKVNNPFYGTLYT